MKFLKSIVEELKYIFQYWIVYDSFIRSIHNLKYDGTVYSNHIIYNGSLVIHANNNCPVKPNHFVYVSKSIYLNGDIKYLPKVLYIEWDFKCLPFIEYETFAFFQLDVNGYLVNDSVLAILS